MKNLFLLFAMAVLLCAGMAVLCTACAEEQHLPADGALSRMEPPESAQETTKALSTTDIPEVKKDSNTLEEPDLQGVIQEVGQSSFTVIPVYVQAEDNTAMAAAGESSQDILTVNFEEAEIETVRVYNGGHEEIESASSDALVSGRQVYLYGQETETGFSADRILVLRTEANEL